MKKIAPIITTLLAALLPLSSTQADWNYIHLSSYYLLPNQNLTVTGAGFSPSETITVSVAGLAQTTTADSSGNFSVSGFVIPFSMVGSTQTVRAIGDLGHVSTANLSVGSYYPVVSPSSYYVAPGGTVNFSGQSFAPGELVSIVGGGTTTSSTADSSGSFTSPNITVPNTAGDVTYIATGHRSQASYRVTVHVSGTGGIITLNSYYGHSGDPIEVTGNFFGSNEKVVVTMANIPLGQATTNGKGFFSLLTSVPNFPADTVLDIQAQGLTTKKIAVTKYTTAWDNTRAIQNVGSQTIATQASVNQSRIQNFTVTDMLIPPPAMPSALYINEIESSSDNNLLTSLNQTGIIVAQ